MVADAALSKYAVVLFGSGGSSSGSAQPGGSSSSMYAFNALNLLSGLPAGTPRQLIFGALLAIQSSFLFFASAFCVATIDVAAGNSDNKNITVMVYCINKKNKCCIQLLLEEPPHRHNSRTLIPSGVIVKTRPCYYNQQPPIIKMKRTKDGDKEDKDTLKG